MNADQTQPSEAPARAGAGRWTIAMIVVGVALAVTIFVLVVLAGLGGSSSVVARWVPADTAVYAEVRLDLPGDQEANLGAFLSHFPGFDDTSRLPDKLAELGDRLMGLGSGGQLDYSQQIAPWFGGQIGLASRIDEASQQRNPGSGLVVATVSDDQKAAAWLATTLGRDGGSEVYLGVTITTGAKGVAWAVPGAVALVGDSASVKAAIDTKGGSAFASRNEVSTARKEVGGDQVVFVFADTGAMGAALDEAIGQLPVPVPSAAGSLPKLPPWVAGGLRFETSAAVGTTVVPHIEGISAVNAESVIPTRIPATTILLLDAHDVGPRLTAAIDSIGGSGGLGSIDGALRLLGGSNGLVGWISEAAIVIDAGTAGPTGGVVATSSDATKSQSLFTQLQVAARLAGAKVEETDSGGTTIVSVELSGLDRLLGGAGLDNLGGGLLPVPVSGPISLSWAVQGDLVVIGATSDFVKGVLSTTNDTSLGSTQSFKTMLGEAGRQHAGLAWIDIGAGIDLAEKSAAMPEGSDRYTAEIAPYLKPLDAALGTFVVGGSVDRSTVVVSVTEPD